MTYFSWNYIDDIFYFFYEHVHSHFYYISVQNFKVNPLDGVTYIKLVGIEENEIGRNTIIPSHSTSHNTTAAIFPKRRHSAFIEKRGRIDKFEHAACQEKGRQG